MKKHVGSKYFAMLIRGAWAAKSRIIAIFGIVALGVGFLFGMISTAPDMYITAEKYYEDTNMMDIRILSTYGFTEDDIAAIREADDVLDAMGGYNVDIITHDGSDTYVTLIHSIPDAEPWINSAELVEGRMPQSADECIVDSANSLAGGHVKLGDVISFESKKEAEDSFTVDTFTVVGIARSSRYFSVEKESSTKGNGIVSLILYAPEASFAQDVYTSAYVRSESARALSPFDEEYDECIDTLMANIKSAVDERLEVRYSEVKTYAAEQINELKEKLPELQNDKSEKQLAEEAAYSKYLKYNNIYRSMKQGDVYGALTYKQMGNYVASLYNKYQTADKQLTATSTALFTLEKTIAETEEQIASLEPTKWFYFDRDDNLGFKSFKSNAEKIDAIAKVFPVFFFLVALLVSLTTMTRMVDEDRLSIGTMKALGYNNTAITFKYLFYALISSVAGSVLGILLGARFLPSVIFKAYSMMYTMPPLTLHFDPVYALTASLIMILGVVSATYLAVRSSLSESPASLLRPKSPKAGKRIFLEHIRPLWRKMSFSKKVTARNIFLYKKRFFMTVIGVAGCTALLLTGFGLRDSISGVVDLQFNEVYNYNVMLVCYDDRDNETFENTLSENGINDRMNMSMTAIDASNGKDDTSMSAFCVVPKKAEDAYLGMNFRDVDTKELLTFTKNSVFITDKMAEILDIGAGDSITLTDAEENSFEFKVDAVVENYFQSYVYIGNELYTETTGIQPDYLVVLGTSDAETQEDIDAVSSALLENKNILSASFTSVIRTTFDTVMEKINYVVYILIIAAAALAFIVLYNLINVNIAERHREIATVKVLGFYDNEVNSYVFREIYALTAIGSLFGIFIGILLHRFVIKTLEMEFVKFGNTISPLSYILAIVLTLGFCLLVSLFMRRSLKRIDMVESLKSIE